MVSIGKIIIILIIISPTFLWSAKVYHCEIDIIKNLKTNDFQMIAKNKRLKVTIEKHKNFVYLKVKNQSSRLNYIQSGKIMGYLNADIYANNVEQLEIIDIEKSYSTGARYFYKDNMYMIGFCKKQ